MLYLSYIDLTPGLENKFSTTSHHSVINVLRRHFDNWTNFFDKYPDHSLGLIVATKEGVTDLNVKGPTISKKSKTVDYSIFIPQDINDMTMYLDNIFKGLNIILKNYDIKETHALKADIELIYKTLVVK